MGTKEGRDDDATAFPLLKREDEDLPTPIRRYFEKEEGDQGEAEGGLGLEGQEVVLVEAEVEL